MICKTLLKSVSKPLQIYSNGFLVHSVRTVITSPSTDFSHQTIPREVEEIKIPVPWGHLAAKWWGPKNKRPILMAHGWQDNCGTFNTLVPHLRSDIGYLAFDFPGHGLSSHFPLGTFSLHGLENTIIFHRILKYFNWDSMSLITHSMGAITAYNYAAFFPGNVDLLIGFDSLKPISTSPKKVMDYLPGEVDKYLKLEEYISAENEPPSYSYDELIQRLYVATRQSIDEDKCHHILERNIKSSSKDANKFYFARDPRLKYRVGLPIGNELTLEMAVRIKCPMLTVKAVSGSYFEEKKNFYEVLDLLKKHNPLFEYVEVPGKHHIHLNEPEKVAPLVNVYLEKYAQHLAN